VGLAWASYADSALSTSAAEPQEPEDTTMVELAPPEEEPEPLEPEPEREPVVASVDPNVALRPAPAERPELTEPQEVPDEELEESDGPLREETSGGGPTGGDTRGRGGTGSGRARKPAPPPPPPDPAPERERRRPEAKTEAIELGRPSFTCPEPSEVRSQGLAGVVLVDLMVDAQGRLRRFDILRGHSTLADAVRQCLKAHWQDFRPTRQADGTPVAWRWRQPFRFRARN
jgi:hypothetical protein